MIAPLAVTRAYAAVQAQAGALTTQAASLNQAGGAGATGTAAQQGPGFEDILKNSMSDVVQSSRNAETQMIKQAQGKADLIDVATAVQSAQSSLQTVLAVRDQVIQAYQNIMAMPI